MSREKLKFSVILPVRNPDEAMLGRALASVRKQTYPVYEILLTDDGSDAESAAMLERAASEDDHIRLFHIPPSGVSAARNFAAEQASGEIITYLDGDDALYAGCFEEAAALFADPSVDALWGGTKYVGEAEMREALEYPAPVKTDYELEYALLRLTPGRIHESRAECIGEPLRFEDGGYINRGIAARFIRKEAFAGGKCRFPEGIRMYEDAIWNLKMMEDLRIAYVRSVWYYYLDNEASASNRFHPDILEIMETPLGIIRSILDLSDETEYKAYTRLLMDSLRYVFKCLYGNPAWHPEPQERHRIRTHIYRHMPWKEIGSKRFIKSASERDAQKAVLFRMHMLFAYWKLTWKKM